jgi:hypothetical protein
VSRRNRGFVFTLDMTVAVFFFTVIVLTMLWVWSETYRHMNDFNDANARHKRLNDVSSILVKTQGNPLNWHKLPLINPDTVASIGLAKDDNVLDKARLDALAAADYDGLKVIMGLGSEDFRITVSENYSGAPVIRYQVGAAPASAENLVTRRYALLNGTRVELKLDAYYTKR